MPHISSKKLNSSLLEKLFGKLINILGKAQDKQYLDIVINELFTPTEKIMLAKRLAIILMLSNSTPQHRIVGVLKVSPSTVAKMSLKIEIGKYKIILKISKKEKVDIEKIVWKILTVGGIMPPKVGRKYWRKYSKR
jgi:uncharacterized protein YerC